MFSLYLIGIHQKETERYYSMAPKQEYGRLLVSDSCNGPETLDWDQAIIDEPSSRRWLRRTYLLFFFCGLLFGIATTCASSSIIQAISKATEKTSTEAQPDRLTQIVEANDTSTTVGHNESDPRCGRDWREAEAAGCRYDIMASRWYSKECFNDEVLNQMLTEVDFDWVLQIL
jgi:hypothetical protein